MIGAGHVPQVRVTDRTEIHHGREEERSEEGRRQDDQEGRAQEEEQVSPFAAGSPAS